MMTCVTGPTKLMLTRRLTTTLPAMRLAEAIETARVNSVASRTSARMAFMTVYPASV
jgi:predicted ATPase with chaperone activity